MALAGVEGTIRCPAVVCMQTTRGGGDAGDFLIGRDLVQKFRQHGRIAHVTGGELGRSDFQCLLVDPDVVFAPDTALRAAILAGVPFPLALDLDAGAVRRPAGYCEAVPERGSAGAAGLLIRDTGC